jgi:hypothetical protein
VAGGWVTQQRLIGPATHDGMAADGVAADLRGCRLASRRGRDERERRRLEELRVSRRR